VDEMERWKRKRALRAHYRGRTGPSLYPFSAMMLLVDIKAHFTVPSGGGRPTNPRWTQRSSIRLAPETLRRLEEIATAFRGKGDVRIESMQLGALLLERITELLDHDAIERDLT